MQKREQHRQYYYENRLLAREYTRQFELTDEEIERRLDEEFKEYFHKM